MPDTQINPTAAAVLGLLHEGPRTGGQLMAAAERRLGPYWSMTRSQVYRELPVLAEMGYVPLGKPGPRPREPRPGAHPPLRHHRRRQARVQPLADGQPRPRRHPQPDRPAGRLRPADLR